MASMTVVRLSFRDGQAIIVRSNSPWPIVIQAPVPGRSKSRKKVLRAAGIEPTLLSEWHFETGCYIRNSLF